MSQPVTIKIATPVASVNPVDNMNSVAAGANEMETSLESLKKEKENVIQAGKALEDAAVKLQQFQEEIFSSHREQIARLSVEIAGKILLKEIADGNYDIGKIVQEALKIAPAQQDIVVRLNPNDLQQLQKITEDKGGGALGNVKLAPDAHIGPGQCVVETDKGMIEYFIEEHLKQISEALKITE
jgi:flagellar biosynthesis/type III secretory pathway protein FliH